MRFRGAYAGGLVVVVGEGGVQCADKLKMMSVSVWFGRVCGSIGLVCRSFGASNSAAGASFSVAAHAAETCWCRAAVAR